MLVWDPVSERNLPFGSLKTAALGVLIRIILTCGGEQYYLQTGQRKSITLDLVVGLKHPFLNNMLIIFPAVVKIFDLLYLNNMSLLHKSLKFRKRNLRACLMEVPGRMEFASECEGRSAKDVRTRMDEIIASRGEGLVIKHPDSEYILNGRNKDWIKVCIFLFCNLPEASL